MCWLISHKFSQKHEKFNESKLDCVQDNYKIKCVT